MSSSDPGNRAIPVYEAVVRDLMAAEVKVAFGLMGEDTAKIVSTMQGLGIKYHGARHENTAVAMAEGYSRATDGLGVAVISRGPGFTNGLTAAVNARKAGTPILIILGDSPANPDPNRPGPEYKAFDFLGAGAAAGLELFAPKSPGMIRTALRDAMRAALKGAAVAISIPIDIVDSEVPYADDLSLGQLLPVTTPLEPDATSVGLVAEALAESRRPLILAGYGAYKSGAKEALIELAERSGAVLGTTLKAKDMFRGHRLNAGIVGTQSHAAGRYFIAQADLVVAFGASLTQLTTGLGASFPDAQVVQVGVERSHLGRYSRADIAVVGDAKITAERALAALPSDAGADKVFHSPESLARLQDIDTLEGFEVKTTQWTIDPRALSVELEKVLPENRVLACDVGNFLGFVPPHVFLDGPDDFFYLYDFSAIGLGFGLALGVAAARPEQHTIMVVGDGALLMTLGELESVIRCDLPMVIIVFNDAAYGAERHYLELGGMSGNSAMYPDVDFADIAASLGMTVATVRSAEDLHAAADLIREPDGPVLIDCKVTPEVRDPVFAELLGITEE